MKLHISLYEPIGLNSVLCKSSIGLLLLILGGCATAPIPLNYAPSSTLTASGAVSVSDFKYLPAENGKVAANQIKNTAIGNAYFDQPIAKFYRDAVFKELRFVGVKMDDKNRVLSGDIDEFLIDDLGFHVDWTLQVHYVVTNTQTNKIIYDSVKTTKRETAKFVGTEAALNETVRLNIDDLIKDPGFIKAIN